MKIELKRHCLFPSSVTAKMCNRPLTRKHIPLPQSVMLGFRGAAAAVAAAVAAGAFTFGAVAVARATVAASVALRPMSDERIIGVKKRGG